MTVTRPEPAWKAVVLCTAAMLLLSGCAAGGESDQADPPGGEAAGGESAEEAGTIAEFCASDPEATDADRARVMDVGPLPEGEPEQVPMPYLDQLDQDPDYQPPSEDGPAENVPIPQYSALLCDADADSDARSAALSQWFELYYYGELTGDEELAAQLLPADCSECLESLAEIRALSEDQMWIDGEPMDGLLHMWQMGEDPDMRIGFVETQVPGFTMYDADGEVETGGDFSYTTGFEFEYSEDVGHWQLVQVHEVSMGGEALSDEGSDQPGSGASEVQAPERPGEAEEKTAEGALAAMDHWFEAFDYVALTGDAEPIRAMHHPGSEHLSHFYENFTESYARGEFVELHGDSHIDDVAVYFDDVRNDDAAMVHGNITEAGWDTYDSSGELLSEQEGSAGQPMLHAFIYNEDVGHWQLAEYYSAEVDELLEDLGMPDAEPDLTR